MPNSAQTSRPGSLIGRQLVLPLDLPHPRLWVPPPAPGGDLALPRVWASLPPMLQVQVRLALRRVVQEVVRDAGQS